MRPNRTQVALIVRIGISTVLLLGIFLLWADIDKTVVQVARARPGFLLAALCVIAVSEGLTIAKWHYLLRVIGRPKMAWLLTKATLIGNFYGVFLPTSVGGDLVRVLVTAREAGGKAPAAAAIFTLRNTGLAGLLLIANFASWFPPLAVPLFPEAVSVLNYVGVWFALISTAYLGVNFFLTSDSAYRWLWNLLRTGESIRADGGEPATGRLRHKLLHKIQRFHDSLLLFRRGVPVAVGISVVTQLLDCLMVCLIAHSMDIRLPFGLFLVYVPAVAVAALLPVSFNGIGLREAVYVVLMGNAGVSPDQAVGISLVHFAFILGLAGAGGLIHWLQPIRRLEE